MYEGLSRSSWTNVKKLTQIIGFVRNFLSIYFDITINGMQNFIQKYELISNLQAIDRYHVQRCAARQKKITSPRHFISKYAPCDTMHLRCH